MPKIRQTKAVRDLQERIPRCSFLLLLFYYAAQSHIKWLQLKNCSVSWIVDFKFKNPILSEKTSLNAIEPFRYNFKPNNQLILSV